ncbi:MAG: methylmalonyl-CoA epimerase [Firmicutes bacterium]|nr:methylmalonyl-CoA epimerase [Candidatus Fermentithermobacillaceae bacterium]
MIKKIDHLGIAVNDMKQAAEDFARAFGIVLGGEEEVPSQKVKVGFLQVGEVRLELLQPLEADSPVGKFLSSRGEGFHHIAFEVDDIESDLRKAESAGLTLVDKTPRSGAHGTKVAFIHPKSTHGLLVELVQK